MHIILVSSHKIGVNMMRVFEKNMKFWNLTVKRVMDISKMEVENMCDFIHFCV